MRRISQVTGTPHRANALRIGRQQDPMGRTARRQQLLGLRILDVILQPRNHHHHQRRPQRIIARLVDGRFADFAVRKLRRFGQQLTHLLTCRAFHRQEAPRLQVTVIRGAHGGTEQHLALLGSGCRVNQSRNGNTVEQSVESLHRPPPEKFVRLF
ncbi:hypothetical protein D9M73_205330 [compost metagenome]